MRLLPPFRLVAEPLNAEAVEAQGFRWAAPEIGTRHRLGGEPSLLQTTPHPSCPGCSEPMTFYAQLDSIGDEYCIADAGMVFVYICYGCFEAAAFVQSH